MLTQHRLFAAHQAEVFFRSAPRHSTGGTFLKPGAKPAHPAHTPANGAAFRRFRHHRIIHPLHDVAVMYQESVAMPCKSASACSLLIAGGLPLGCRRSSPAGIAVPVTANAGAVRRQHYPDFVKARGDIITKPGTYFLSTSTIGAAGVVSNWAQRLVNRQPLAT